MKGIGDFDAKKALEACVATANMDDYTIICSIYNFSTDYRSEWKMHLSISGFGMYCTGNRKAGSSMSDHVRKWDQAVGKTNFGRLCVVEGKPVRITGNRKRA